MTLSKPRLVDVHAHICDPSFDKDRDQVLERARNAGVKAIIAVGENLSDAHKNLELANISLSIKAIAELKDVAEEEVIAAVSENTERLYGKL